jgi:hypothetical protein
MVRPYHIRLEQAPPIKGRPSVNLKFDAFNDSVDDLTDIVLKVSIVQRSHSATNPEVIGGPYIIRGSVLLRPGYSMGYEMRLRNLTTQCDCVASVRVVSARPSAGPKSQN